MSQMIFFSSAHRNKESVTQSVESNESPSIKELKDYIKELKEENINIKKRLEKIEKAFEQQIFVFNT